MKDIIVTAKHIKTEILTAIICFILAFIINLGAIIYYKTSYVELITSIGYVIVTAVAIYALWAAIRIGIYALKWLLSKKKK